MSPSESAVEERIARSVDDHRAMVVELLQRLIRAPSLTGAEGPCAAVCAEQLRGLGLEVDEWEVDGAQLHAHPGANPSRFPYEGRPNVVGRCRGAAPARGRSLILNGHTDVVMPEPLAAWRHDPWAGTVEGGRVYGRGAVDMKGGLAAMMTTLHSVHAAGLIIVSNFAVDLLYGWVDPRVSITD